MKSVLFGAAAVLALATAAHAESTTTTSGYIEGSYTRPDIGASGVGDTAIDVWSLKGAVAAPLSGKIGGQFDADIGDYRFGAAGFGTNDRAVFTPTGHVFYRNDQFTGGAFLGIETAKGITAVGGGGEGQFYVNPKFDLEGAVGYAGVTDTDEHIFGVRVGAKYFITDNFTVGGKINYARFTESGFGHEDLWTYGVKGQYQLKSLPLAVSLAYERGDLHSTPLHSDTLKVGLTWAFGGSLHDRDRHGASLDSASETFGGEIGKTILGANSSFFGGPGGGGAP
ncbi:outer membrane beta-barrel protein [Caulobacter sp. KR2-114]|uniref:outer membrane beta-barrel protein n=1 Tax=Caulobacter sp. KR2-114 TaxID=3400912 RepID=UPI003C0128CF